MKTDHFAALPPEDPASATSVEDLTQTITIFRALIGAGHLLDACSVWEGFSNALLVDLGAYATVTELLAPLAVHATNRVRGGLAIAYSLMGQFDKAIGLNMNLLAQALLQSSVREASAALGRLAADFHSTAAYAAANHCDDLRAAVSAAAGDAADGALCENRAAQAALEGRTEDAYDLLNQAEDLGSDNNPWFAELIEYWRLYLALVADQSLTHSLIAGAATRAHSLRGRLGLAVLRYELFIQQGQFAPALTAAQEHEQLGRNAGIDVAPAVSAFLLAKLGRTGEATFHARAAYQQAWADGPPNSHHWNLLAARQLLQDTGEPVPDLPITDPADVKIPREHEVRTFIAALEAERHEDGE